MSLSVEERYLTLEKRYRPDLFLKGRAVQFRIE